MRRKGWVVLVGVFLLLCAGQAIAQSKKDSPLRSVGGTVMDKSDKPIANAVVFMKNLRTNVVLSHFTDEQGTYRFSGLDPNVDYEIHAEAGDQKSVSRTVTSLDSRKEMTVNLKVDRKKA